jgi:hypothetical protein
MTSYINEAVARQHVADLIAVAERDRVRRQFRKAHRGLIVR